MMVKRMIRLSENEPLPLKIHCPVCRKSREQWMKQSLKRRQVALSSPICRLMIPYFFESVYLVTGAHSAIFCLVLESTKGRSWKQLISSFIEARNGMMIRRRRSEKSGLLGAHGWDDVGPAMTCVSLMVRQVFHYGNLQQQATARSSNLGNPKSSTLQFILRNMSEKWVNVPQKSTVFAGLRVTSLMSTTATDLPRRAFVEIW
jgi:hypothetical protein